MYSVWANIRAMSECLMVTSQTQLCYQSAVLCVTFLSTKEVFAFHYIFCTKCSNSEVDVLSKLLEISLQRHSATQHTSCTCLHKRAPPKWDFDKICTKNSPSESTLGSEFATGNYLLSKYPIFGQVLPAQCVLISIIVANRHILHLQIISMLLLQYKYIYLSASGVLKTFLI